MKFSGMMWFNIKSHKKTRFHSVCRKCKFRKSYKSCQSLKKKTLSEFSEFSILGIEQNRKIGNPGSFLFFFLIHFIALLFCLSSFSSFQNLNLQLLSKFEVKEHFPKFSSFWFWVQDKIENSEILKIFFFSSKSISWPLSLCLSSFLLFLNLKLQLLSKFEVKQRFPIFSSFRFWV